MHELLEREDKWDVDDHFVLPRLHDLIDGGEIDRTTVHLESAYYDTADHDLQSHGIVLRRRDGDDDTGWQLKVPAPEGRIEIRTSLADAPPSELEELLTGLRLGKPLINVATIRTERTRYRIREPRQDRVCAELADDQVHASVTTAAGVAGDRGRVRTERPIAVPPAGQTAQQGRRSAVAVSVKAGPRDSRCPDTGDRQRRAARLTTYVAGQIDAIFDGDIQLRRGQDPIHDTRVAIRRLRSTIRVFGKLLDRSAAEHIDEELKWFAGLLGEVRDRQVQRRRFREVLADWPPEIVLGPVPTESTPTCTPSNCGRARMWPTRWTRRGIWTSLRRCSAGAPRCPSRRRPPAKKLHKRASRAERKADRRLTAAVDAGDDAMLHRARKAAKRARYAAELRRPLDKSAAKTEKHFKRIQRVLGEHQDSVVASDVLRRFALTAGTTAGENGFTYGLLFAREQQIAQAVRDRAREFLR